jgi:predicted transcriptional regulator
MTNELVFETETTKAAAAVLKTLNDKLRQQLLRCIHQKGKCNVTEIYKKLRMEQSVC